MPRLTIRERERSAIKFLKVLAVSRCIKLILNKESYPRARNILNLPKVEFR